MFLGSMKKSINTPHPIPYQGSKRALSAYILEFFPADVETLLEPFAGSAAVSLAAAMLGKAKNFYINDLNEPLIGLWNEIVNNPQQIAKEYAYLWESQKDDPQIYYKIVREKFNQTKQPHYFLYLLARCVKASVRYNSNGAFNQSPDNRRLGARPVTMRNNVMLASFLLQDKTKFTSINYKDVLKDARRGDLVYMDPPYQGVCGNRDNRYLAGIEIDEFIQALEKLNKRNISYIVSYDGRTGDKTFGEHLPKHLNLRRIELHCGRSTQATLLGRDDITYESLYISPALNRRLAGKKELQNSDVQIEFAGIKQS